MIERRRSPRLPVVLAGTVTELTSGDSFTGFTSDVCKNGCFVKSLHPFVAGTPIRVRLTSGSESIETAARIVFSDPGHGMGIAFEGPVPAPQLELLDRWLDIERYQP